MTANKYCIMPLDKEIRAWPSHLLPISSEGMCKCLARKEAMAGAINWQARFRFEHQGFTDCDIKNEMF